METKIDFGREFIALIEDNNDPKKLGRVKARVVNMFDDVETDDLPWASPYLDTNGNTFNVPEVGKVVTIIFNNGNPFKPQYLNAEHMNPNLQSIVDTLEGDEYSSFKALLVDHSTQVYRTSSKGLIIDHEQSNINLTKDGDIKLNLRDDKSNLHLGTEDCQQAAVLGTDFMDWMMDFLDVLLSNSYLGNMSQPIIPQPQLIKIITEFKTKVRSNFLSNNVWLPENRMIKGQNRTYINSTGDDIQSNYFEGSYRNTSDGYIPQDREEEPLFPVISGIPNDDIQYTITDDTTTSLDNYKDGVIPDSALIKSKYISNNSEGKVDPRLIPEAARSFDAMMAAFANAKFEGKRNIGITSCFRTAAHQARIYKKYGSPRAAKKSVHQSGRAVDIWYGVPTALRKTQPELGFINPNYQWFHNNSYKFGWHNLPKFRNAKRISSIEWWHFEFNGDQTPPPPLDPKFQYRPYTEAERKLLR